MTAISDIEIVQQTLSGNVQAYSALVNRYQDYAFTLALRIVGSREDAEEVAQDCFVKAYRALADFRNESKFSTWLYTIVNRTSLSFLKKKKEKIHSLSEENVFNIADSKVSSLLPVNGLEQKSKSATINAAIAMLKREDAEAITLFYLNEQSLEEIAAILGIEMNAAKVRLHRARQRLKDIVEKHFVEELKY
ncbi:MAG: RNA polymerase sigma factor [Chitinophagaceae bacterium]|jgi:RNA polymerase sigma-70 factor (ECF subfamily)|nr:RNA polymerase sigma factor [Chitinophagaceae bacterium]